MWLSADLQPVILVSRNGKTGFGASKLLARSADLQVAVETAALYFCFKSRIRLPESGCSGDSEKCVNPSLTLKILQRSTK